VRHGAGEVVFGDLQEFLFGFRGPERVLQDDSAGEGLLDGRERDGETDRSKLNRCEIFMMMLFVDGGDPTRVVRIWSWGR
jgi:hypothetical protein